MTQLFFHGTEMQSLHKHIDPACLPENYGGKLPKVNYSSVDWYPVLRTLDNEYKGKKNTFITMTGLVLKWSHYTQGIKVLLLI